MPEETPCRPAFRRESPGFCVKSAGEAADRRGDGGRAARARGTSPAGAGRGRGDRQGVVRLEGAATVRERFASGKPPLAYARGSLLTPLLSTTRDSRMGRQFFPTR